MKTPEIFLVKLSCQIGEVLPGLVLKSGDIKPLLQKDYWPSEWFSKSSFMRSFPICQKVLDISQIVIASAHNCSSNPDGNSTADVSSFILRTVLLAISFVSDLGVEVR